MKQQETLDMQEQQETSKKDCFARFRYNSSNHAPALVEHPSQLDKQLLFLIHLSWWRDQYLLDQRQMFEVQSVQVFPCSGDNIKLKCDLQVSTGSSLSYWWLEGLEPKFSFKFKDFWKTQEKTQFFSFTNKMCTIWDDARTYLVRVINPKDKTALIVAINHFKNKERNDL